MGKTTYIESLGVYLPANEISSEARVAGIRSGAKLPLARMTGIKSTRQAKPGEYSLDLARHAIERALERSGFRREDIGLIVACNICKYDRGEFLFSIEPNTASRLRREFGFANAVAFDINNACAGMINGILVADSFLHANEIDAAIVVSGEYISHVADTAQREITDTADSRLACLTLGDAGAAIVLAKSHNAAVGFQYIGLSTLGAYSSLCQAQPTNGSHGGLIMYTDSARLQEAGARETVRHSRQTLQEQGWPVESIDHVIPHQVSRGAIKTFFKTAQDTNAQIWAADKIVDNLERRGNTASTSHMVALHDHIGNGRIESGDRIVFCVTASGLTVGTALYVLDDLPSRMRRDPVPCKSSIDRRDPRGLMTGRESKGVTIASVVSTRSCPKPPSNSLEMAVEAAENCLRKVPHLRPEIGVLLFVGVFRSGFSPEPSFASILAGRLFPDRRDTDERSGILAFDVHGGQGGFLTACETFRSMAVHRHLRAGIVIAAEFENNRLTGYPELGVAEVASATIVTLDGSGDGSGFRIAGSEFFSFDQYEDVHQIDFRCANPAYTILQTRAHYEECLRECICSAVRSYVARIGISIPTFAKFYFPQISSSFLHALGQDLDIPCERIVDITIDGRDLYTSSLPCLLEETERGGAGGTGHPCLAVSAGPGINVICAIVRT